MKDRGRMVPTGSQRSILHMWNPKKADEQLADAHGQELQEISLSRIQPSKRNSNKFDTEKVGSSSKEGEAGGLRLFRGSGKPAKVKYKDNEGSIVARPQGLFPIFSRTNSTASLGTASEAFGSQSQESNNSHAPPESSNTTPPASASSRSESPDVMFMGGTSQEESRTPSQVISLFDGANRTANAANGKSRDKPILVDYSPEPSPRKSRAPIPDFFARRKVTGNHVKLAARKEVPEESIIWPTSESQHLRGEQSSFDSKTLDFGRRRRKDVPAETQVSNASLSWLELAEDTADEAHSATTSSENADERTQERLKPLHVPHSNTTRSAMARFNTSGHEPSDTLWNDRTRPRRAAEVLANTESAAYLRDWLLALEIKSSEGSLSLSSATAPGSHLNSASGSRTLESQNSKRAKVIRSVDKPRKRRKVESDEESIEDWIADDDDDDTVYVRDVISDESDEEHLSRSGSPWKPKLTRLTRQRPKESDNADMPTLTDIPEPVTPSLDFSNRLTNSILLCGPHGSGKTAAVYACAEELGWEVFEVYPGIGKRNGASLMSLVGDVGKNHIVGKGPRTAPTGFFQKPSSEDTRIDQLPITLKKKVSHQQVEVASPSQNQSNSELSWDQGQATGHNSESKRASPRQSIILLEEVDILFGDDINFWPTVVTLIRESRRPVIMTCNDSSLVPSEILPLQSTLFFNVPSRDIATTYLQRLAITEGHEVPSECVEVLYEGGKSLELACFSHELAAYSLCQISSSPDLRRAINALQFFCLRYLGSSAPASAGENSNHQQSTPIDDAQEEIQTYELGAEFGPLHFCTETPAMSPNSEALQGNSDLQRLWRLSDSSSVIDSSLSRRPTAILEMRASEEPSADYELGHMQLVDEPETSHLQGGIVLYNYDQVIALEALKTNIRAFEMTRSGSQTVAVRTGVNGISEGETVRGQKDHLNGIRGVLSHISPATLTKPIDELILDYQPWVRSIDQADSVLEAAGLKDSESRAVARDRGGRTTRNSLRAHYERYFSLSEEHRDMLHGNTLSSVGMGNLSVLPRTTGADG